MAEFSTNEMVKNLSKAAHAEENKSHLEQAANLYRAIVTLEEMAHFPANKIQQAQKDVQRIEEKHFDAMFDAEMEKAKKFHLHEEHPSRSNDNGIFREQKPKDSNDNGIFRQKRPNSFIIPDPAKMYEV